MKKLGHRAQNKVLEEQLESQGFVKTKEEHLTDEEVIENKRLRKHNQCGKVCFISQHAARRAKKRRLVKGSNVNRFREYFCRSCHSWHLSSSINKRYD